MRMRALPSVATTSLALLALLVAPASATSGSHFQSVSGSIDGIGALVVKFTEAGLGNADVTYTLTATGSATWGCINGGGKHPKAANKETFSSSVATGGTFQAKNGRVTATLSAGPVPAPAPGDWSCPAGQTAVLFSLAYAGIVLTDTTNGVTASVADVSRQLWP